MLEILLSKEEQAIYNNGGVAKGVRADTLTRVQVQKNANGEMCLVVGSKQAYKGVTLDLRPNDYLNLNRKETAELIKNGTITVTRSNGVKAEDGKTLTRAEQIANDSARVITVVMSLKAGAKEGSQDYARDYDLHIMGDNSTRLEPIK